MPNLLVKFCDCFMYFKQTVIFTVSLVKNLLLDVKLPNEINVVSVGDSQKLNVYEIVERESGR